MFTSSINSMHPAQVIAELKIHGTTAAAVARKLGVSRAAVHAVIYRIGKSRRIADAISKATGKPVGLLFGDTYKAKRRAA